MATLKLGLIFSENTSATIFFWGHYHGQTAVEEKDSLVFYIWKSDSQHRFFSTVCTGWKQLCDLDAHGRCWVPYGSHWLQLTHNWSMPHHTPTLSRQWDQEDAAGLTCKTSGPSKGRCLLASDSFPSEPSILQTQHLHSSFFSRLFPQLADTMSSLISIQLKLGRCNPFGWHFLYL